MKVGDKIRVIRMNGVVEVISHIDGIGQIHLEEYGLELYQKLMSLKLFKCYPIRLRMKKRVLSTNLWNEEEY